MYVKRSTTKTIFMDIGEFPSIVCITVFENWPITAIFFGLQANHVLPESLSIWRSYCTFEHSYIYDLLVIIALGLILNIEKRDHAWIPDK